jgi:hypothetical protein
VTQLEASGVTWKSYQEDITGDVCPLTSVGQYKPKHNPMVFFDDVTNGNDPSSTRCVEHVRPLTELEADLSDAKKVARYNFITPNQCDDMHSNCATGDAGSATPVSLEEKQGDDWLALWVPKIMASDAYKDGGALFITWDEAEGHPPDCALANCPIGMFLLSPLGKGGGYKSTVSTDHSSTLRTMQEIFGVSPFLRAAATATDLSDLFVTFP